MYSALALLSASVGPPFIVLGGCAKGRQCFEWWRRADGPMLVELEPLEDLYFAEPVDPLVLGEVEVAVMDC